MQINLNTDCAIRVLLSLSDAGCPVTINSLNKKTNIPINDIDFVISKLVDRKLLCHPPDNIDQHSLTITPDKATLECVIPAVDDVLQIDFDNNKNQKISLSNMIFSALDKRLVMNL